MKREKSSSHHSFFLFLSFLLALFSIPAIYLLPGVDRILLLKLIFLPTLGIYSLFLCHINSQGWGEISFPLFLFFLIMFIPIPSWGLLLLTGSIFGWIRSGICFNGAGSKKMMAELFCLVGWSGFLLFWSSPKPVLLPLATCFFFLSQSIYFFIVAHDENHGEDEMDTFDRARFEIDRLFET